MNRQSDLFSRGDAPAPRPAPSPDPEPQQADEKAFDPQRHSLLALGAPFGSRYCFEHDAFEFGVAIYVVGRRAMFLCEEAGVALGGEKWRGWETPKSK